jgi:hypothetical protein
MIQAIDISLKQETKILKMCRALLKERQRDTFRFHYLIGVHYEDNKMVNCSRVTGPNSDKNIFEIHWFELCHIIADKILNQDQFAIYRISVRMMQNKRDESMHPVDYLYNKFTELQMPTSRLSVIEKKKPIHKKLMTYK